MLLRRVVPSARLIVAPHEPDPGHLAGVATRAAALGLPRPVRLSRLTDGADAAVILVDRVGVLADLYAAADVAFVGGGFHRAGLHSVLEPAVFGAPVTFGPQWANSRDAGLLLVVREDGGPVLGAHIGALPVQGGGIMKGEEDAQEIGVGQDRRVEPHLHHLRVAGGAAAHLLVGRVRPPPTRIPGHHGLHAAQAAQAGRAVRCPLGARPATSRPCSKR